METGIRAASSVERRDDLRSRVVDWLFLDGDRRVAVVAVAPLAVFATYVLRAATVAYRTVSVGPFVPPGER